MKLNDDILRLALLDAAADEYADIIENSAPPAVFSRKYLKKRSRFLNAPHHNRAMKILIRAAIIAVVIFALAFSSTFTQSANATDLLHLRKVYKDDLTYSVSREYTPTHEIGIPNVTYLPEGFSRHKTEYKTDFCNVNYTNGSKVIDLVCFHTSAYMNISLNSGKYFIEACEINGEAAVFHRAYREGCTNVLMWFSQDSDTAFLLDAPLSKDEMIKIAESIILE